MKKQKPLVDLSLVELEKRAKFTKSMTWFFVGVMMVQLISGIYLTVKQGFSIFIIIPIAFLPMAYMMNSELKKINEEIAKRKS